MRPFPKALGNRRWLLVGTNYFTKWVEAKPLANIRDMDAKRFVWKILSLGLGFLIPSSRTTDLSLIARLSEGTTVIWVSRIGIPLQPTPRGIGKLRLSIRL